MEKSQMKNPLGTEKVSKLMVKFAVPSIISMIVGSIYNIVDQLFIGQTVGTLGNAATNVAFPISTSCVALGLLFGVGGASCFNLAMGRGESEDAGYYVGNSAFMLAFTGLILFLITEIFLDPILYACGSPFDVLPYARVYMRITAVGFPFFMLTIGGGHLIRADGSPRIVMQCSLLGAVINIVLDALFVMVFKWGMAGAAYATIIGQIASGLVIVRCLMKFKTVDLGLKYFKINPKFIQGVSSIGAASFINQMAMMVVQITLNNSLRYYGANSIYGEAIPLACAGIVIKVGQIFFSVVIGLAQASQPIQSFNYGAKNYDRVKESYKLANTAGAAISVFAFILFQLFPRQLMSIFGEGSELYYEFGAKYFRIFLFFICLNFLHPITSTLFTSIGKPIKGTFLSLTRQIIFLLPLVIIMPIFMGIDGIVYAAPIADFMAIIAAITMAKKEFKNMNVLKLEKENSL